LPTEYALEAVVQALSCNTTVERLDIREGDSNLYLEPTEMFEDPWWYGREQVIMELIISGLEKNTSIKEIHLKGIQDINIYQFVNIAKYSRQLETVYFHGLMIMKAKMSHILTQLPVKEVIFKRCIISEEVVQQAVDTLKHFDHPFLNGFTF
jgi:hypothetical protein